MKTRGRLISETLSYGTRMYHLSKIGRETPRSDRERRKEIAIKLKHVNSLYMANLQQLRK